MIIHVATSVKTLEGKKDEVYLIFDGPKKESAQCKSVCILPL
jgi:hypothetical protein